VPRVETTTRSEGGFAERPTARRARARLVRRDPGLFSAAGDRLDVRDAIGLLIHVDEAADDGAIRHR
jgi:hypothetical protein